MTDTTAHTPGPWTMEPCPDGIDIYAPKGRICMLNRDEPEEGNGLDLNACLIAAAPDLLAALETLMGLIEMTGPRCISDYAHPISAARAAIAKAKGE